MSNYFLPSTLLAALGIAAPAFSAVVNDTLDIHSQDQVIVTATRTEESVAAVLAPVSVVERADIERQQSKDVVEILSHIPGTDLIRSGGPGSAASLYLRGTNDDHTLFLIDGQRISSATLGSTNFQLLDPEQIDRIEVVRGPRSSLYGSDAIGGVVQIFTRRPGTEPSAYVKAGYGSHDSSQIAAGGDGSWEQFHYAASVSHYYTGGISNRKDKTPDNNDRDAYRNSSLSLRAGYDFTNDIKLDLAHLYTKAMNQYDLSYDPQFDPLPIHQPFDENWIQSTSATLHAHLIPAWNSSWTLGRAIDDSDTFAKFSTDHANFRTTRDSASWQNDVKLDELQTVTLGTDFYKEKIDTSNIYTTADGKPVESRLHKGFFGQYLLIYGPIDVQAGLRRDHIQDFDRQTTGNIALGFNLPAAQRLILSYGTGFKAPTFNDLYWPADPYSYGNPNLKAETSKNYEIEWRGSMQKLNWAFNFFQNDIKNLIDWAPVDANDPSSAWTPSNVANARIRGAEFHINGNLDNWLLAASLSYINPRDTDANTMLVNRSRRNLKLDVDRDIDHWSFGVSWRANDFRYADKDNTQKLSGYGLVDIRAGYSLSKNWQAQLKLNNIFDKNYEERQDFNVERFGTFATITYRM